MHNLICLPVYSKVCGVCVWVCIYKWNEHFVWLLRSCHVTSLSFKAYKMKATLFSMSPLNCNISHHIPFPSTSLQTLQLMEYLQQFSIFNVSLKYFRDVEFSKNWTRTSELFLVLTTASQKSWFNITKQHDSLAKFSDNFFHLKAILVVLSKKAVSVCPLRLPNGIE